MEHIVYELSLRHIEKSADIIRRSFKTVADDFGFTIKNNPTNGAFITADKLNEEFLCGHKFFGMFKDDEQIGFVSLEKSDTKLYYLKKLAVLPEYRHNGCGKTLIDYARDYVKKAGGTEISLGMINDNIKLKGWYESCGFVPTELKKFPSLPFTVCYMSLNI